MHDDSRVVAFIEVRGLPVLQRSVLMHWTKRRSHDRRWQQLVGFAAIAAGLRGPPLLLPRVHLLCTRLSSGREPDRDNLAASFKPLIDALKPMHPTSNPLGIGMILDDSPDVLVTQTYAYVKVDRRHERIRIEVRAVEAVSGDDQGL